MQPEPAGEFIIDKLQKYLPKHFTYHSVAHAFDVRNSAECIAQQENVSSYEMQLLLTAALYHDSGFLAGALGHEEESCRIVKEVLPAYGYTANEIDLICGMIMATKLPQTPHTLLESILADADLDYLGRDDFFTIGDKLFKEFTLSGATGDKDEWNKTQLDFMKNHCYFTEASTKLRRSKKEANIELVKAQLKNMDAK
jgi:uncharacterized protein